jgi:ADP-ribosylglycohydrolase
MSARDRIAGGLLGLALGDAVALPVARLSPVEAAEVMASSRGPLVHGAQTTWALTVIDALTDRPRGVTLGEELAHRLALCAEVHQGIALRGGPQTAAGTLRQVGSQLGLVGQEAAAIDEPRADALSGAVPLALALGDDEDDLIEALLAVVLLTHRHPEVVAAAGLLVGGIRAALFDRRRGEGAVLDEGLRVAQRALELLFADPTRAERLSAGRGQAEGAMAIAVATARASGELEALCPIGLDTRDAPARVAAACLCTVRFGAREISERLQARGQSGGDADVLLPLIGAVLGARDGVQGLPLGWLERLITRPLILTRARALLGGPRPRPLALDEIRLSRQWLSAEPLPPPDDEEAAPKEQLPLL